MREGKQVEDRREARATDGRQSIAVWFEAKSRVSAESLCSARIAMSNEMKTWGITVMGGQIESERRLMVRCFMDSVKAMM